MRWELRDLPREAVPGLSTAARRVLEGEDLPSATPALAGLEVEARSGSAWRDAAFLAERRDALARMRAPAAATDALARLERGAAVVVTGQQPGVMGGSLMSVLKVMGAIALAEAFRGAGMDCVAAYWCGADDSDFAEVRGSWLWSPAGKLYQVALPASMWRAGLRVGDLAGPELVAIERAALDILGPGPGQERLRAIVESLPEDLDFGERAQAWVLHLLAGRPLVTVDARSRRLRELGASLFGSYTQRHALLTSRLTRRTEELSTQGWDPPLAVDALRSGLFHVDADGVRRKLGPEELDRGLAGLDPTPSVMLRPVWQDVLLSPLAAVLGPAELAYHAQLTPLYEALGVTAAAPVSRPHLVDWPAGLPWPRSTPDLLALLAGGDDATRVLQRWATPADWTAALEEAHAARAQALDRLQAALATDALPPPEWRHQDDELHRRWRRELEGLALSQRRAEAPAWEWATNWLTPRGIPQERVLNAVVGWWRWGDAFDAILNQLAERYVRAVQTRSSPAFAVVEDASP